MALMLRAKIFKNYFVISTIRNISLTKKLNHASAERPPAFKCEGKAAIVTGGASGIGFCCAEALISRGLAGVMIIDKNSEKGEKAVKSLNKKYGKEVSSFKQVDVSDIKQFDDAFKKTVEKFGSIDILVNNAGILDEVNWKKMVKTNVLGTIHGSLLGMEKYMIKHRRGSESIIVNMSSVLGLDPNCVVPIYAATRHLVIGFSGSYGAPLHYNKTKIRMMMLCPGLTTTKMSEGVEKKVRADFIAAAVPNEYYYAAVNQSPESVGMALLKVIDRGGSGSIWVSEAQEVYEVRTQIRDCRRVRYA